MSVITNHVISTEEMNIKQVLTEKGFLYSGDLFSRRMAARVKFDYIFDFGKCCPKIGEELVKFLKKNHQNDRIAEVV